MLTDAGVAHGLQIIEKMVLLERKMTIDVRLQAGRQVRQQTGDIAVCLVRRAGAAATSQQLLKPFHQSNGRAVLVMKRLADPVGEAHRSSSKVSRAIAGILQANHLLTRSSPDFARYNWPDKRACIAVHLQHLHIRYISSDQ